MSEEHPAWEGTALPNGSLVLHEELRNFSPSLAIVIGFEESVVYQQLHYWLKRATVFHEGRRWVYNTSAQWHEQFPWWSESTIRRIFAHLVDMGIVLKSHGKHGRWDNTTYYTIDYSKVPTVHDLTKSSIPTAQIEQVENAQIEQVELLNLSSSSIRQRLPATITGATTTDKSAATPVAASPPVPARVARAKGRVPGVSFAPLIDAFRTRNVPPPLLSAPPEIKAAQHLLHAFSPEQLVQAWSDYAGDFGDAFDHDHLSFAYLERESRMPRWVRWCAAGRPAAHRAHPKSAGDMPRASTQPRWNRPDADDLARYRAVDTDPIRILARVTRSRAADAPDHRPSPHA